MAQGWRSPQRSWRVVAGMGAATAAVAVALVAADAAAVEFNRGDLKGSFDTTITVGATFRVEGRDPALVGRANGGTGFSVNGDNGNLNYDKGLAALSGRVTHELKLSRDHLGLFVRGTYYYDVVNGRKSSDTAARTGRFDLSSQAVKRVGRDAKLLDALAYGSFDAGPSSKVDIRVGNQVLSWGESTFIQNGINIINPVDVSALRVPGSELKEALLPVPIADINVAFNENFSIEGFYQFMWEKTEPEAAGTFFSTSDAVAPGARYLLIGFANPLIADSPATGAVPLHSFSPGVVNPVTGLVTTTSLTPFGSKVPRAKDARPDDQGQFGFAARYFAPGLGDTEFGAYYVDHHSRLPVVSTQLGTLAAFAANPSAFTEASSYRLEYPEHIHMLGASFNTTIFGGISLQGEYSFRKGQPLQLDDVELVQATLAAPAVLGAAASGSASFDAAVARAVASSPQLAAAFTGRSFEQIQAASPAAAAAISAGIAAAPGSPGGSRGAFQAAAQAATTAIFNTNQIVRSLGGIDPANPVASAQRLFGQRIQGWRRFNVSQLQMTATKAFGPTFGADQWLLLGEVGATYVHGMPGGETLRLDGPGTTLGGNPYFIGIGAMPAVQNGGFATQFSWGYRLAARFDYLNAIAGINLSPSISWQHDVNGTTPSPIGNFVDGRKAVSLGLRAAFLEQWVADLSYSAFFGGGTFNLVRDRDFVSISIKYSF
jgi:hypothetical protein